MLASKEKNAHARTMATTLRSSGAIFRNIPGHNAIVIMQGHRQRKRDNTNNASVILLCPSSRNHGIVILRFCMQAFVTFRNISSAYHSHKPGLSVQTCYVTVGDWHKYRRTIVQAYYYAAMRIQRYCNMIICGWAHNENDSHYHSARRKSTRGLDRHLAGS